MIDGNGSFAEGYAVGRDSNGGCCNGNGNGFFGGDGWWAIILFAMIFGWGNGGWGGWGNNNGVGATNAFLPYAVAGNSALTRADLCSEFNFNGLENSVRGVQQGLCDGFYAMNTGILNGFSGVSSAICNLGYEQAQLANNTNMTLMNGFNSANIVALQNQNALQAQLAQCCCDNKAGQAAIQRDISDCCCTIGRQIERGFCDVNYNMATNTNAIQVQMANNTRDIIDSQREGTRAVLDWLCAKETADLRAENQSLKLAASQERQNNYLVNTLRPMPQPSYLTCNPFTGTYGFGGYGFNGNYGCNSCNSCNSCC